MEQGRGRGRASNGQKNAEKKEGKIVIGAMRGDVIQERWQESQKQSKRKGRNNPKNLRNQSVVYLHKSKPKHRKESRRLKRTKICGIS